VSDEKDRALLLLLAALKARNYRFITPTPATHARVIARRAQARDLRDVFGWSLPFAPAAIGLDIFNLMQAADILDRRGDLFASRLRVSTLGEDSFLHSAYPTTQQDAVFFGPDSYRFAAFLAAELPKLAPPRRIVDIGAGAGVGGIVAAGLAPDARVTLTDINPQALHLARINAAYAGVRIEAVQTNALDSVDGAIDCVIANPPYIADASHRAYRDGGDMHGGEVSRAWARAAAERLEPGGALLLYTGSAIIDGEDRLKEALLDILSGFEVSYLEIDPDVFGEELERADYADVERIAAVGLVAMKH
jgi:methylase of polypeptide subunit release factors